VERRDACGGAAEGRRLKNRRAAELSTFLNLSRMKLDRSALGPSGWTNDGHRGLGTRPPPNGSRVSCGASAGGRKRPVSAGWRTNVRFL